MFNQKTVLVIEDDEDQLEMIDFAFSKRGYRVFTAHDGREGLQCLKRVFPDLIILDVNMPRMGGIEFYANICGSDGKSKYPVLILTARANIDPLFREWDVDGLVLKPVGIKDLFNAAEAAMKKSNRQFRESLAKRNPRKVLIVEDQEEEYQEIKKAFFGSGYMVEVVSSAREAMQKIFKSPPDLALIKLSLPECSGDIMALKLKFTPHAKKMKTLVYIGRNFDRQRSIVEKLSAKTGIIKLVEYFDAIELLHEVDKIFHIS